MDDLYNLNRIRKLFIEESTIIIDRYLMSLEGVSSVKKFSLGQKTFWILDSMTSRDVQLVNSAVSKQ